ncbi:MAG: DUF3576 domain-containing protein [Sphingopyxis sp.]|nr:DUF3576 domain-containing protein [Sphingopyxis sp.]
MIFSRPTRSFSPARAAMLTVACSLVLTGCGGRERAAPDLAASQVTTIGVNAYLWRASLDALSFAPLVQADSNGGVIVTDWYANPGNPGERVKLTVAILDRDLRADALRVSGARQVAQGGAWVDAPLAAATVQRIEEIILTKARDLRRTALAGD